MSLTHAATVLARRVQEKLPPSMHPAPQNCTEISEQERQEARARFYATVGARPSERDFKAAREASAAGQLGRRRIVLPE